MEPSKGRRGRSGVTHFQVVGRDPMPRSIEEFESEALQLPPEDRARIARTLLASLHGERPEDQILEVINRLPLNERLRLLKDVLEGIAATPESVPLPESHRLELDHRLDHPSPEPGLTWDEVRARLRRLG